MKLVSFRVSKFRNIVDSGEVEVGSDITSFVGKNEAGKSALLEALYLLNPLYKTNTVVLDQYPRWLLNKDRKNSRLEEHTFITANFLLEETDMRAAEAWYGKGTVVSNTVSVARNYEGDLNWNLDCDENAALTYLTESLPDNVKQKFINAKSLKEFRSQLQHFKNSALGNDELEMIASRLDTDVKFDESLTTEALNRISDHLHSLYLENGDLESGIGCKLAERLPKFFLFTQYNTLPGRINLTDLAYSSQNKANDPNMQTASSLIKLAGTDLKQLRSEEYELRRSELEAVGIDLSREVNKYWKQNPNLEVSIDIDKINVQHGDKSIAVPRYMELRLKDTRTGYSNNFKQRSSGFQWFFSFLAAFSEFEGDDTPIVLLDEPAVRLHGKSQEDFLNFIQEKLASSSQVLYTTHSPFMVHTGSNNYTKIVEDLGPPQGSVVLSESKLSQNEASTYPLRIAAANEIAQNIFIHSHTLIVENPSDFLLLETLSDLCQTEAREYLDERWEITPAGNGLGFALMGNMNESNQSALILTNTSNRHVKALSEKLDRDHLQNFNVILLESLSNAKNALLEDLFAEADYLTLANKTIGKKLKRADIGKEGNIIERIESTSETIVNRNAVAKLVLRGDVPLRKASLEKFEQLFKQINLNL